MLPKKKLSLKFRCKRSNLNLKPRNIFEPEPRHIYCLYNTGNNYVE